MKPVFVHAVWLAALGSEKFDSTTLFIRIVTLDVILLIETTMSAISVSKITGVRKQPSMSVALRRFAVMLMHTAPGLGQLLFCTCRTI